MGGSSIFVTYGIKSGGGAPFLRRTRNAFGQLETRTSTAANVQERAWGAVGTRVCSQYTGSNTNNFGGSAGMYQGFLNTTVQGSGCQGSTNSHGTKTFYFLGNFNCSVVMNCPGGTPQGHCYLPIQCLTNTFCRFPTFSDWINTTNCTAATPACSPGALKRECREVFSFREEDWSPFEEAETCDPVSPTPADGAVEVECIAN